MVGFNAHKELPSSNNKKSEKMSMRGKWRKKTKIEKITHKTESAQKTDGGK